MLEEKGLDPSFFFHFLDEPELRWIISCYPKESFKKLTDQSFLHKLMIRNNVDVLRLFCETYTEININATDNEGNTPLHLATNWGNADVISFLLANGADVMAVNANLQRPIHIAAEKNGLDIIKLLSEGAEYEDAFGNNA